MNHPNICTLHDVGHQEGIDSLAMEFLEGETLAERLIKGPLPPAQVLKYRIEIWEGLETAHKKGDRLCVFPYSAFPFSRGGLLSHHDGRPILGNLF